MKTYLCGRPGCNGCPSVELLADGLTVEINDDYGGSVQMTKAEYEELRKTAVKDL